MDRSISTNGGEEMHGGFWWGQLKQRDHLEYLSVNGRIIIKLIFKPLDEDHGED